MYDAADRLAAAGRAADARRTFFDALSLSPENPLIYVRWANLEASVRDKHEALRLLGIAKQYGFTNWRAVAKHRVFSKVLVLKGEW
jgi:Flp pilus assembly protein TadD